MITGGFGVTIDLETGASRAWYMGPDGVQRWADTGEPVERGDQALLTVTDWWIAVSSAAIMSFFLASACFHGLDAPIRRWRHKWSSNRKTTNSRLLRA